MIVKSSRIFVSTSRACPQVMSDLLSAWVLSSSSPDPGTGLSSALDQARLGYHAQVTNHSAAARHVIAILIADWPRCAWLGELDSAEESDEISSEFDFQQEVLGQVGAAILSCDWSEVA